MHKALVTRDPLELLRRSNLFSGLDEADLTSLAPHLEPLKLAADEGLFEQNDRADGLYLVAEGTLSVYAAGEGRRQRHIGNVGPGQCVGEMGLVYAGRRSATVRAVSAASLFRLGSEVFARFVAEHPAVGERLRTLLNQRLPALRASASNLFGAVDDSLLQELESRFTWHILTRGEILFHEGDYGDSIYLVVNGRLQVLVLDEDGEQQVVADIGPGEWIGDIALILDEPRSATVRATRDTELVGLTRADFDTIIERHPQCLRPLVGMLARRLRATTLGQRQTTAEPLAISIAVVPLDENLPELPPPLIEELGRAGPVLVLDAARLDDIHGPGSSACLPDDTRTGYLNEWFSQQERIHRYVIYQADPVPSPWTRRCIRNADRILYMARADGDTRIRDTERLYTEEGLLCPRELVLLHPGNRQRPRNTARWLEQRDIAHHHHVREGNLADARRVSRLLTGRATGLVLSGGGARGFAHIGVIRALKQAGFHFDAIGGTSIGGFIGSLYACDLDEEEVIARVRHILVDPPRGIGYGVPYTSMMRVDGATQKLQKMYDGLNLEDHWLQFYCVSSNLTRIAMQVHRTGPAWKAIRATTAVPGIFPPVIDGDEVLIDGGIMNNLPVEIMARSSVKDIIACDVTRASTLRAEPGWHERAGLRDILMSAARLSTHSVPAPRMSQIINHCMDVASLMRKRQEIFGAKLYLAPPIAEYPLLAMQELERLIEIGYSYTRKVLEEIGNPVSDSKAG